MLGTVRYLAPYAPPINHAPPPNEKPSASLCDYPDVTKGTRVHPLSRRVITEQSKLGAYNVVDAYLDL